MSTPSAWQNHGTDSFHQRLSRLEQALAGASREVQPMLAEIHQATRRTHDALEEIDVAPVLPRTIVSGIRCFDCGTAKMDSFHTSKQGGYHLCPPCFDHRVRTGRARTAT